MDYFITIHIYLLMVVCAQSNVEETPNLDDKNLTAMFELFMTRTPVITTIRVTPNDTTTTTITPTETATPPSTTSIVATTSVTATLPTTTSPATTETTTTSPTTTSPAPTSPTTTSPAPTETTTTSPAPKETTTTAKTTTAKLTAHGGARAAAETTTTSTTTTSTTTTTTEANVIPLAEVIEMLTSVFNRTIGFLDLQLVPGGLTRVVPQSDIVSVEYKVIYSVFQLSEANALCSEDNITCLVTQLDQARDEIVGYNGSFSGGFVVEPDYTNSTMTEVIATFTEDSIDGVCYKYGDYCSNINNTCFVENGRVTCTDKCTVYTREINPLCTDPESSLNNIFKPGTCVIKDGNPVCDCGHSLGGIMQNFYDGTQCISSAFVVGIAAGVGGFIIVVLLGVAIGFGCKSSKRERSRKDVTEAYGDSSFGRSNNELAGTFDNLTYESCIDSLQQFEEHFPNFQPSLSHIDPKADYTFPRPNISMEHINMFVHAKDQL